SHCRLSTSGNRLGQSRRRSLPSPISRAVIIVVAAADHVFFRQAVVDAAQRLPVIELLRCRTSQRAEWNRTLLAIEGEPGGGSQRCLRGRQILQQRPNCRLTAGKRLQYLTARFRR